MCVCLSGCLFDIDRHIQKETISNQFMRLNINNVEMYHQKKTKEARNLTGRMLKKKNVEYKEMQIVKGEKNLSKVKHPSLICS